jgi:hypothetical protein
MDSMRDRHVFLLAVCVVCLFLLLRKDRMVWHLARLNNTLYYVKNMSDGPEAAEHLARLDVAIKAFLDRANARHPNDPRLRRIAERWSGTLSETPTHAENVAYSVGKNSIYICVREKDGTLANYNTSLFVLLHELAHVATDTYGHTKTFWKNMKYLLELADELDVYTYVDHDAQTEMLCGKTLGTNPLSCVKNKTCVSEVRVAELHGGGE